MSESKKKKPKKNKGKSKGKDQEDSSSLEEKCRFCLDSLGEPDSYFRPCKCNSFLHYQCLEAWQKGDGNSDQCETCLFTYQRKKKYSFAECSLFSHKSDLSPHIFSHKSAFKSLFLILYYLAPYLWRFDAARSGFYPGFYYEDVNIITVITIICSWMWTALLFCIWNPIFWFLNDIWETQKYHSNHTTYWLFPLTKIWHMYVLASIPLLLIGIIHLIGYCLINYWWVPHKILKDNDIFHGASIITFFWGTLSILTLVSVLLFLFFLGLLCFYLPGYLKNLCCIVSETGEIKPYKGKLDI